MTKWDHEDLRSTYPNPIRTNTPREGEQQGARERSAPMRTFETGATRNSDVNAHDFEGFISPLTVAAYGRYMHKHRKQADGTMRDSDNWQKGIPVDQYIKSMYRHFVDVHLNHRGYRELARDDMLTSLLALKFNVDGAIHELEKKRLAEDNDLTKSRFPG